MLDFIKNNLRKIPEIDIDQEIIHFYYNQKKYLHHLIIIIIYKGNKLPKYCYPMLREPPPKVDIKIKNNLAVTYFSSLKHNHTIEDGAILIQAHSNEYILKKYSCRICPPQNKVVKETANKGSGYNSAFYYSCVSRVLSVYLINKDSAKKFVKGKEVEFKIN